MLIKRITDLTEPPLPGEFYLVPTVRGRWCGEVDYWPVWGEKHEDAKFFNFNLDHYHLDRRFIAKEEDAYAAVGAPLHSGPTQYETDPRNAPLPAPEWRRRKCYRAETDFPTYRKEVKAMQTTLAGVQCRRGAGWICPHRGFDTGSIHPNQAGIIICPLHGLQIHVTTGRVIGEQPA